MKVEVTQQEEYALLTALKAGGQTAFKYFYQKYSLQLYRKLLKMVQSEEIAEELLQDLFLRIWDRRMQIDPAQSFKAYLYRIAEHIVYDHFRKAANQAKANDFLVANSTELYNQFDEGGIDEEMKQRIHQAIAYLPAQQQAVFRLCKLENKSYEEVSQLLGISTGTINTHITRATKTIKAYMMNKDNFRILVTIGLLVEMNR